MTRRLNLGLIFLMLGMLFAMVACGMIATEVSLSIAPGLVSALVAGFGGQDVPGFSHFLGSLFVIAGGLWVLLQRRVWQVPSPRISTSLLLFVGVIWVSVGLSRFRGSSLPAAWEWSVYALALWVTVAVIGRWRGPLLLGSAMVLAGTLVSLNGILEYLSSYKLDKTWRIFAGWTPNSLASILLVLLLVCVALAIAQKGLARWVTAASGFPMLTALALTQSKGGLLAFGGGVGLLVLYLLGSRKPNLMPWLGRLTLVLILAVCTLPAFVGKLPDAKTLQQTSSNAAVADTFVKRFQTAGSTSDQSVGFRKLLWASSIRLVAANPIGTGIGTFRAYSSKPGLTTQTQLAHNSLLQIAQETGILGLVLFLGFFFLVTEAVFANTGQTGRDRLRLGIYAALAAGLLHSATESNLYTFGFGLVFFVLIGICLQLATDATTPEFAPAQVRVMMALGMGGCLLLGAITGFVDVQRGVLKYAGDQGNNELASSAIDSLQTFAPNDPETWMNAAALSPALDSRIGMLERAVEVGPFPRYLRALAAAKRAKGDYSGAIASLREVLYWDPCNLLALDALIKTQLESGDKEAALQTAQQLVEIENKAYFQIRSIKELVPTETYSARLLLAQNEPDLAKRKQLLLPAIEGFVAYAQTTVPQVKQMAALGPNSNYGGENVPKALKVLDAGKAACKLALDSSPDPATQKAIEAANRKIVAAIAQLS